MFCILGIGINLSFRSAVFTVHYEASNIKGKNDSHHQRSHQSCQVLQTCRSVGGEIPAEGTMVSIDSQAGRTIISNNMLP